jgi:hypothetical protein
VLAKLRSQRITAVRFKPHAHMLGITNGQEMDVSGVDGSVRTHWDEQLFVVTYLRDSLARRASEPKLIVMNGDTFVPVHGLRHPGRIPPPGPRASPRAIAAYVSSLRRVAAWETAHVVAIEVMRPGPIGVALTLRVRDPARFLMHRLGGVLTTFKNRPTGVLAGYLGVRGPTGKRVFEISLFPTGTSMYVAQSLRGCIFLIGLHGMPGEKIPPCPVR